MRRLRVGGSGSGSPASTALTRSKSQGSPSAPRPIMTPAQPVCSKSCAASAAVVISPLASTGTDTAARISPMAPASMGGTYICSRVRPWTAIRSAPLASHWRATSTPVRWSSSQPMRILTVRGMSCPSACRAAATIRPQSAGSSSSLLPAPPEVILGAGQPIFRSRRSKAISFSRMMPMAAASVSGSAPKSCTAYRPWGWASRRRVRLFLSPKVIALAEAISLTVQAAPWSAIRWRQAPSESPAMGAKTAGRSGRVRFRNFMNKTPV